MARARALAGTVVEIGGIDLVLDTGTTTPTHVAKTILDAMSGRGLARGTPKTVDRETADGDTRAG